jgi:mycofactocin precursor
MEPTELVDDTETAAAEAGPANTGGDTVLVEEELLVEEISIDGMCGVY